MKSLKKILIILVFFSFSNFLSAQDIPTVDDINKLEPKLPAKQESSPSEILKEEQSKKEGLKLDFVSFEFTSKLLSLYLTPNIFEILLFLEIFSEVKLPPNKLELNLYWLEVGDLYLISKIDDILSP